ncbi:MAG TPA: UDP-N-acetylmuramoyl-tripeptide--D-alanyl-D-alanine ligase [Blastocatellia bacterium]|jgi:UDP-N-acetylmuramoyl-tripeptide--D-alanyl-D-alanine ligase|nr:UDP-N-acetylmuramoyl-tripeptide--D-alanyl-D-alanine ligase [Blastocatellia bacterium]
MKLGEIARILGSAAGGLQPELSEQEPSGYSIDSRSIQPGELFFAIRGEKYDGHQFVEDALKRGALAAVVSHGSLTSAASSPLLPVEDTLAALQSLAAATLKRWKGQVVAVTGSMGKTTTKDLTAALLSNAGRVIKTVGNLNNAYGLPLSILRMESGGAHPSDFDFAVFEMGMNHTGEIADLTRIAPPNLAVVTNVAPVHLEFFSSVDEIAEAKAELILGIAAGGTAVLNADDERVARMRRLRSDIEIRTFGISDRADVMAKSIQPRGVAATAFELTTPSGSIETSLNLGGRHNVYNALAAAAVAESCGVHLDAIAKSLSEFSSPKMRGEVHEFAEGFTLIDDSYNSNPRALLEMVATICSAPGYTRRVVVAGEMLELGEEGTELHRDTGRRIAEQPVDLLIGVRGLAREMIEAARESGISKDSAVFCETPEQATEVLKERVRAGDLVLVKGSRGVRTDIVVERMKQGRAETEAQ